MLAIRPLEIGGGRRPITTAKTLTGNEVMTTLEKRNHIQVQRERHHDALAQLAGKITGKQWEFVNGRKLWQKLRRIEEHAHRGATAYCNGEEFMGFNFRSDEDAWEKFSAFIQEKVEITLGGVPAGFFVNCDARGFALKLEPGSVPFALEQDWGSNQLLAPTIE